MVLLAIRSKSVYKYKIYKIIDEVTLMSKLANCGSKTRREEREEERYMYHKIIIECTIILII